MAVDMLFNYILHSDSNIQDNPFLQELQSETLGFLKHIGARNAVFVLHNIGPFNDKAKFVEMVWKSLCSQTSPVVGQFDKYVNTLERLRKGDISLSLIEP